MYMSEREREIEGKRERSWRNIYISRCLREREREERERKNERRDREREMFFLNQYHHLMRFPILLD